MAGIHITDIEAAINWWRDRSPSPDGITACAEVRALAEVYALMVYYREPLCDEDTMPPPARAAWLAWYADTPDAPCIAICSTSQGDAVCKGCGRTFEEVQRWTGFSPADKRSVWRRITLQATAWRFNRYAERARLASGADHPAPGLLDQAALMGPAKAAAAAAATHVAADADVAAAVADANVAADIAAAVDGAADADAGAAPGAASTATTNTTTASATAGARAAAAGRR